ncbi:Os10g0323000, partial [Oryza sativa Japonica Group]
KCSLSTSLRLTAHVTSSIVHEQSSNIRYGENRKHGQRYAYHELFYDDSNNICYAKVHTVGWRRFSSPTRDCCPLQWTRWETSNFSHTE